jgi:putative ATP-binding cassette transporter
VRALAGAWPWGGGEIAIRADATLCVLPQRPYVPTGTLRRAVTYPDAAHSRNAEEIANVLELVELGHLAARLDEDAPWEKILSGGEKQRLAFARLFLQRPDIVVLDEATAALDTPTQDRLMQRLSQELAAATVVSIGHRPELARFHHRKIVLEHGPNGARLTGDAAQLATPSRHPCRVADCRASIRLRTDAESTSKRRRHPGGSAAVRGILPCRATTRAL